MSRRAVRSRHEGYTTKLVFIILTCALLQHAHAQKYNRLKDMAPSMGWKEKLEVWPPRSWYGIRFWDRISLVIVNIPKYLNSKSEKTILVPSVLIDSSRLLTAYNPFRDIIRKPEIAEKLVIALPQSYTQKTHIVGVHVAQIVCGRQIVYLPDDEVVFWHDAGRKHSPVHDLMVLRVEEEFGHTGFTNKFTYDANEEHQDWHFNAPIRSYVANVYERLGSGVAIYSLGYRTTKEMKDYNKIHPLEYESLEDLVVDCEEFMSRDWGYFICLRNKDNFPGMGAGAMLYSKNKLFGIGSFILFRNDTGILVFTDVRPYRHLIDHTCTDKEFSHKW